MLKYPEVVKKTTLGFGEALKAPFKFLWFIIYPSLGRIIVSDFLNVPL